MMDGGCKHGVARKEETVDLEALAPPEFGARLDHRKYVAGSDWTGAMSGVGVVKLLEKLGLKPQHRLLDFGCGSLRLGRWLIPYLEKGNYFGIEPNLWLVEMGRMEEVPTKVWGAKRPTFSDEAGHDLSVFSPVKFDFVLASAVLIHSSHQQISAFINSLPEMLEKGGTVLAETRTSAPDYEGDGWSPRGGCHPMSCFIDRADRVGLKVMKLAKQEFPGVWFTLKR